MSKEEFKTTQFISQDMLIKELVTAEVERQLGEKMNKENLIAQPSDIDEENWKLPEIKLAVQVLNIITIINRKEFNRCSVMEALEILKYSKELECNCKGEQ